MFVQVGAPGRQSKGLKRLNRRLECCEEVLNQMTDFVNDKVHFFLVNVVGGRHDDVVPCSATVATRAGVDMDIVSGCKACGRVNINERDFSKGESYLAHGLIG